MLPRTLRLRKFSFILFQYLDGDLWRQKVRVFQFMFFAGAKRLKSLMLAIQGLNHKAKDVWVESITNIIICLFKLHPKNTV